MSDKVVQFSFGLVNFFRNRRSKSIRISVKPDKSVLVSYPWYVSSKEAQAFVVKNERWILEQQGKFNNRKIVIEEGSVLNTKLYNVLFFKGDKFQLRAQGNTVNLFVKDFHSPESRIYIENAITHLYRYEAKKLFPARLAKLAELHGFKYNGITIRNNKCNWGSCSSRNNISLNLQMMKLPDELIDYILLHELVHTVVKNHGPVFWEKLNGVTHHKAKELAREVKKYSTYNL